MMRSDENVVFLQNNDVWNELLRLDISSGSLNEIQREGFGFKIRGHYKKLKNDYVMFYRKNVELFFRVNNKEVSLEDGKSVILFKRMGRYNLFQIELMGEIFFQQKYQSCLYDDINKIDPDFNEEREEDIDFYLFVFNVMNENERRKRIYNI